jgi:hypothetical protein
MIRSTRNDSESETRPGGLPRWNVLRFCAFKHLIGFIKFTSNATLQAIRHLTQIIVEDVLTFRACHCAQEPCCCVREHDLPEQGPHCDARRFCLHGLAICPSYRAPCSCAKEICARLQDGCPSLRESYVCGRAWCFHLPDGVSCPKGICPSS